MYISEESASNNVQSFHNDLQKMQLDVEKIRDMMQIVIANQARQEVLLANLIDNNNNSNNPTNIVEPSNEHEDLLKLYAFPINDVDVLIKWNVSIRDVKYNNFMVRNN